MAGMRTWANSCKHGMLILDAGYCNGRRLLVTSGIMMVILKAEGIARDDHETTGVSARSAQRACGRIASQPLPGGPAR